MHSRREKQDEEPTAVNSPGSVLLSHAGCASKRFRTKLFHAETVMALPCNNKMRAVQPELRFDRHARLWYNQTNDRKSGFRGKSVHLSR